MGIREILAELMRINGDDAYAVERKSGVPQPTTHRFLTGKHGDPRSNTVKKWAGAYGITESQLRGFEAIPWLNSEENHVIEGQSYRVTEPPKLPVHSNTQESPTRDPVLDDLAALLPEDAEIWRIQIKAAAIKVRREKAAAAAAAAAAKDMPTHDSPKKQQPRAR